MEGVGVTIPQEINQERRGKENRVVVRARERRQVRSRRHLPDFHQLQRAQVLPIHPPPRFLWLVRYLLVEPSLQRTRLLSSPSGQSHQPLVLRFGYLYPP